MYVPKPRYGPFVVGRNSERDPLHLIKGNLIVAPVIEPCGETARRSQSRGSSLFALLRAAINHRTILTCCYAAGLRVSEAIHLKPAHIEDRAPIAGQLSASCDRGRRVFIANLHHLLEPTF